MSYANKFLGTGTQSVTDGSIDLFGLKIGAKNLINTIADTVKIDATGRLYPSTIDASDVTGIVTNPLLTDLDINNNNITNSQSIEVKNATNSTVLTYTATSDTIIDLDSINDLIDVTQNITLSTTDGQTDIDGDVVIGGDLQFGGSLIGDLVITDVNIPSQTTNLKVSEQNSNFASAMDNLANNTLDIFVTNNNTNDEYLGPSPTHLANIYGNTGNIATDTSSIDSKLTTTNTNTGNTYTAVGLVNTDTTAIKNASNSIDTKTSTIVTNTGTSATNSSTIVTNTGSISTNTSNINTKLPATLGQKVKAESLAVTMASDQTIQVQSNLTDLATEATVNSIDTRLATINTKLPTLGQKPTAGSIASVLSDDYASTAFVATDGGNYVLCGLDSGLVTGYIPMSIYQLAGTNITTGNGTTSAGTQRVTLSSDYTSTAIQRPFTSSMYFEKMIITGNLSGSYTGDTITFGSWPGSGTQVYLVQLALQVYSTAGFKMDGWGSVSTPLTGGFYIDYKRNSSDTAHPIMGTSSIPIKMTNGILRECDVFNLYDTGKAGLKAICNFKNNPILIENASVPTRGEIRITFINPTDTSAGTVTSMYLLAGYYYS